MAANVNFTKRVLEGLAPPEAGRIYVYDAKTLALAICVTAAGARTFYVYRRFQGRPQRIRLGAFPQMTVEQARKRAAVLNGEITQGRDPAVNRRQPTLAELFAVYLDTYAEPRNWSWREDERMYKTYLPSLHSRRIGTIRRAEVTTIHNRIGKDSPYQANRVLALLSALYGFADAQGWTVPNPCRGMKRFPEQSRDRCADAVELKRLFEAVAADKDERVKVAVLLALLTGARKRNLLRMRWADLDLERGRWRIPEADSRSGYRMAVILAAPAVRVLSDYKENTNCSEYTFPGRGGKGHLHDIRKRWAKIHRRARLADLRMHVLRRTLGSWMAAPGASLPIIGKALGHRNVQTAAAHARLNLDPFRRSVERAATAMLRTAKPELPQHGGRVQEKHVLTCTTSVRS